jgi:hypothetical protein
MEHVNIRRRIADHRWTVSGSMPSMTRPSDSKFAREFRWAQFGAAERPRQPRVKEAGISKIIDECLRESPITLDIPPHRLDGGGKSVGCIEQLRRSRFGNHV